VGDAGWPALILLITFALMIVGALSGWDMGAGNAFIAALVLIGTVWVTWAAFEWSRDLLRRRLTRAQRKLARTPAARQARHDAEVAHDERTAAAQARWETVRKALEKDVVRRAPLTPGYDEAPDEAERSD